MSMKESELPKKWFYTFVAIAIAAAIVFIWACIKKDTTIMVATGMVAGIQIINVIKWLQVHRKRK